MLITNGSIMDIFSLRPELITLQETNTNTMNTKIYLLLILFTGLFTYCSSQSGALPYSGEKFVSLDSGLEEVVTATIIYDNYVHSDGLEADWGYAIMIEGLNKKILYDTGTNPKIFRSNFEKLNLNAEEIDEIFISHEHGDHFGGLHELLSMSSNSKVVVPNTFSGSFIDTYMDECSSIELISGPTKICNNLYSTGVMGEAISEQALVLNTNSGLVVMTGCSHPGIIEMLVEIKATFEKEIYLVFGGFHLMNASDNEIEKIISAMKDLGVKKCGATHCTGEKQIEIFREAFGKNFVEMGAGNVIVL
jgi:7,8-dihydropterin-6-yl-methyl-4-(beta-D-ribofuranosyl)aminobenzene 5'-phosphate synthase